MSGTAHRQGDTPPGNDHGKGNEEPEDQTSCCCLKSSRSAKAANRDDRKGHTASGSGKATMPDGQRNGETKKDVDHPSWIPATNSSNGEAIQRQDYMGGGSLSEEKKPDRVVETISGSDAGQGWLKDKRESSFESFEDKMPTTPESKFISPETDLSRKQQKGHSPMKTLGSPEIQLKVYPPTKALGSPEVQQKVYPPTKALGSPEVQQRFYPPTKTLGSPEVQQKVYPPTKTLGSPEVQKKIYPPTKTLGSPEVQQKLYAPMKTLGSPEVQQKLYPPTKTLGSPEVSHLLPNEQKKANPPTKTVRSAEAGGNFLSKEQQKIESPRKTGSSSTEAGKAWSKEKQKIEPPRKTVSTETDQQSSKQQLKGYSPVRTENSSTQPGQLISKEQQKIELPSKIVSTPEECRLLSNEKQKALNKQETSYGSPIEKKLDSPMKTSNAPKQDQYTDNSSLGQGRQLLLKGQQKDVVKLEGINKDNIQTSPNHTDMNKIGTVHASSKQQKGLLRQDDICEARRDTRQSNKNNW
ncbi:hypothetical protein AB3S75_000241 [Citrus x aurantiifolia]